MNLVRLRPWSIFDPLPHNLNRALPPRFIAANGANAMVGWRPSVDIVEHADRFVVRADLPGVDSADIDVSLDDGILSITGERRAEEHRDAEGEKSLERRYGRFSRRFSLPEAVDAEAVTAKSTNGILEISIPKQPEVQARRIAVETA